VEIGNAAGILCVDKTVRGLLISNLGPASPACQGSRYAMLQRCRAGICALTPRGYPRFLPQSERHCSGGISPSTAARSSQTEAAAASSKLSGSAVWDYAAAALVSLG
jgi:hypothetical protein